MAHSPPTHLDRADHAQQRGSNRWGAAAERALHRDRARHLHARPAPCPPAVRARHARRGSAAAACPFRRGRSGPPARRPAGAAAASASRRTRSPATSLNDHRSKGVRERVVELIGDPAALRRCRPLRCQARSRRACSASAASRSLRSSAVPQANPQRPRTDTEDQTEEHIRLKSREPRESRNDNRQSSQHPQRARRSADPARRAARARHANGGSSSHAPGPDGQNRPPASARRAPRPPAASRAARRDAHTDTPTASQYIPSPTHRGS